VRRPWAQRTLGEIVDQSGGIVQTGPFGSQLHSADYTDGDGVVLVMPKDMVGGRIDYSSAARVNPVKAQEMSRHACKPLDVLLARRGAIGRCVLVHCDDAGVLCGTGSIRVSVQESDLDPTFLFYFLSSAAGRAELESRAVGATMANLSASAVRMVLVPSPPLDTQRKVAAVLAAYDGLIENNQRRIGVLEEMAVRIYREWFVSYKYPSYEDDHFVEPEPREISARWRWRCIGELVDNVRDSVDPRSVAPSTPYFGLEHIPEHSLALDRWGVASDVTSLKFQFQLGDVLFGKIRPYFHKVGPPPVAGICSTDALVLRTKAARDAMLVLAIVSGDAFVAHAVQTSQGTKMPRADWKVLQSYPVAYPDPVTLSTFDNHLRPMVSEIQHLVMTNRTLAATRDLLLPRIMSGDLELGDLDIQIEEAVA
jgi:type I restriction enzyme S subunit